MNLNDFQEECMKTAIYPNPDSNLAYPVLGLVGEAGEVANKVKKLYRDYGVNIMNIFKDESDYLLNAEVIEMLNQIASELGDLLWYCSAIAYALGADLECIAESKLEQLRDRQKRGVLKGNGDNR